MQWHLFCFLEHEMELESESRTDGISSSSLHSLTDILMLQRKGQLGNCSQKLAISFQPSTVHIASHFAAMMCHRMEQALEQQEGAPLRAHVPNDEALREATSMSDWALRPCFQMVPKMQICKPSNAAICGGESALEPPFGRVPKKPKVEAIDLQNGSCLTENAGCHHQASASSASVQHWDVVLQHPHVMGATKRECKWCQTRKAALFPRFLAPS